MALVEISFWLVNLGRYTILKPGEKGFPDFTDFDSDTFVHDGIKLREIIKLINHKVQNFGVKLIYISENFIKIEIRENREFVITGHFATLLNRKNEYLEEIKLISDPLELVKDRLFTNEIKKCCPCEMFYSFEYIIKC